MRTRTSISNSIAKGYLPKGAELFCTSLEEGPATRSGSATNYVVIVYIYEGEVYRAKIKNSVRHQR